MALKNMVGTIAHEAVTTAASVVRHPFGTAAKARELITETAGAGIGLVRGRLGGAPQPPAPRAEADPTVQEAAPAVPAPVDKPVAEGEKPVAEVEKPVAKKAPAEKPAAKKAPAEKSTATKPAAKKAPAEKSAATKPAAKKAPAKKVAAKKVAEDPRDHIPGPDLATFAPPAPEDLPEPIVIEAE